MTETKDINSFSQTDASNLIKALERETEAEITRVQIENEKRIREIEDSYNESIEQTRQRVLNEYSTKLDADKRRIQNRGETEKIKASLVCREEFTDSIIQTVISELRDKYLQEYTDFLKEGINQVIENTEDSLELVHHPLDLQIIQPHVSKCINSSSEKKIILREDQSLLSGGILIKNMNSPFIYNLTIDRIVHRKKQDIRNRISSIAGEEKPDE